MNFDDNAMFRRPEILELRDFNEENPAEIDVGRNEIFSYHFIHLTGHVNIVFKCQEDENYQ